MEKAGRCLMRMFFMVAVLVLLTVPAEADLITTSYDVQYYLRGDISQSHIFYGPGSYEFLWTPNYVTVYLLAANWEFIGMYGAPALGYPQAILPDSMPVIAFPAGTDAGIAVPITIVGTPRVAVPEPSSLAWLIGGGLVGLLGLSRVMKRRAGRS